MSTGASKRDQTPAQDRADTFKARPMQADKASRAFGPRGTPDPNGSGQRPKGKA